MKYFDLSVVTVDIHLVIALEGLLDFIILLLNFKYRLKTENAEYKPDIDARSLRLRGTISGLYPKFEDLIFPRNAIKHYYHLNSKIITTNNRYGQRRCLEVWHINMNHHAPNREDGSYLPYKSIFPFLANDDTS